MKNEHQNPRNDTAHGTLLACGGGYTIYMAWQMIQNTKSGLSSMPMGTTVLLSGVLALGGALVLGYGLYLLYRDYRKNR